jgi:hypothetical protein
VASLINYDESPESFEARSERLMKQDTRPLQARDPKGVPGDSFNSANLVRVAHQWQTPTAGQATNGNRCRGGDRTDELLLAGQAMKWQTPRASDPEKGSPNQSLKGKPSLTAQGVKRWPTAAASDYKGSAKVGQRRGQLSEAILKNGHQAPTTPKDGDESPLNSPSSPRLNPAFVEWLMNWPAGMSLPWPVRRISGPID